MRGKMDMQINHLFNDSGIFTPGESKHEQKEELREEFAQKGKSPTWSDFGQNLTIYSYKTAENYKDVWHQVGDFAKQNGINNIEKLDGNTVTKFLESKIDQDVSLNTFRQYAAACGKLEVALEMYAEKHDTGNTYNYDLSEVRSLANETLEMPNGTRAYDDPSALIGQLDGRSELIANLQYEGGFRISEVLTLKAENLQDGIIHIDNTKGGLPRDILNVTPKTYSKLEIHLAENGGNFCGAGEIKSVADSYREDLKIASVESGQSYTGSHGLRWNYCQESYSTHIKNGATPERALSACSSEMGHRRSDITLHYLK